MSKWMTLCPLPGGIDASQFQVLLSIFLEETMLLTGFSCLRTLRFSNPLGNPYGVEVVTSFFFFFLKGRILDYFCRWTKFEQNSQAVGTQQAPDTLRMCDQRLKGGSQGLQGSPLDGGPEAPVEERALELPRPARGHHTRVPTRSGVPALSVGRKEGVTACSRLEPSMPITCDDRDGYSVWGDTRELLCERVDLEGAPG